MAPRMSTTVAPMTARPFAGGIHVRSASVPCHRHPLLTHVDDQLRALQAWTTDPGQNPLSLAHVRALLCVLDELLQHQHHLSSSCASIATDRLLDRFLALADAYGTFLAALLSLRQHAAELRAAVRRRDPAKIASAARAQRRAGKELVGLAAAVARCARASSSCGRSSVDAHVEIEVARTVAEAINDTAVASASVFLEVGSLADAAAAMAASSSSSSSSKKMLALVQYAPSRSSKKQTATTTTSEEQRDAAALEKLQELEQCIGELESESEKVFRSLVQARVSLLNIHTPTF